MTHAEQMRRWRANNREAYNARANAYNRVYRKLHPKSKRADKTTKCGMEDCGILLISKYAGKKRKKYCTDCSARTFQLRNTLSHRRLYQPLSFA